MFFSLLPSKYRSVNLADVIFSTIAGLVYIVIFYILTWVKVGRVVANELVVASFIAFVVAVLMACFFVNSDGQFGPEK